MLHSRVPIVLDGVVAATNENVLVLGPLVLPGLVHHEQNPFFFVAPGRLLQQRIYLVEPSLPALLPSAAA